LSYAHLTIFGGGIIPDDDIEPLAKIGVAKIFKPGASTVDIVAWVKENIMPSDGT